MTHPLTLLLTGLTVERALIHPLETTYLVQQRDKTTFSNAAKQIHAQGGASSFYVGVRWMFFSALPVNASIFGVYHKANQYFEQKKMTPSQSSFLSGAVAGLSGSIVYSPVEAVRLSVTFKEKPLPRLSAREIGNVRGYYYGYSMVLMRMLLFGTITLGGGSELSRRLDPTQTSVILPFSSTLVMGFLNTIATTAIDNVRIQHWKQRKSVNRETISDIARDIHKSNLLLNGLTARWLRFTLGPALIMGTSEIINRFNHDSSSDSICRRKN